MLGTLGWQELLIILVILALLFGARRVGDLGGALGKGIREFRTSARGDEDTAPAAESVPAARPTHENGSAARIADEFVDEIVRLTELHDRGSLTDDQFEEAKARLLARE